MGTSKPTQEVLDGIPPPPYDIDDPSKDSQSKTTSHIDADSQRNIDLEDGEGTNVRPARKTPPVGCCKRSCCWMFFATVVAVVVVL